MPGLPRRQQYPGQRRWHLARVLPKTFGDRLDLNARRDVSDDVAELMKLINDTPRELPSARRQQNKTETG